MVNLTPITSFADPTSDRLNDCEVILDSYVKAYSVCEMNFKIAMEYYKEAGTVIQQQQEDLNAWYRKPEYTVPAALILGLVLGVQISK